MPQVISPRTSQSDWMDMDEGKKALSPHGSFFNPVAGKILVQ